MLRSVLGVVAGYAAMAAFVFLSFSLAYLAMGAEGAFRPDSYEVSMLWMVVSIVLSLIAAVLGGYVCSWIARGGYAAYLLALAVLALGLVMAFTAPDPVESLVRDADVGNVEAMQYAVQPTWMLYLNPFLGASGVLIGASARTTKPRLGEELGSRAG